MKSFSQRNLTVLGTGILIVCASAWAADRFQPRQIGPISPASPQPSATSTSTSPGGTNFRELYRAWLRPVNPNFSAPRGRAEFIVDGGFLGAAVKISGVDPNITHEIYLSSGSACPDLNADTNGDGIIDANEFQAVTSAPIVGLTLGQLIIGNGSGASPSPISPTYSPSLTPSFSPTMAPSSPTTPTVTATVTTSPSLNPSSSPSSSVSPVSTPVPPGTVPAPTSLPNQLQAVSIAGTYPMASGNGNLAYIGSGPLSVLGNSGGASSPTPSGNTAGNTGVTGALDNVVIFVTGVDPSDTLPSSVGSPAGETANQSLPVACGVLARMRE